MLQITPIITVFHLLSIVIFLFSPSIAILDSSARYRYFANIGGSSINMDDKETLVGIAYTNGYGFTEGFFDLGNVVCSVQATMTGPNVSVSDSQSTNCNVHPHVTLTSSSFVPGARYCISASHTTPWESETSGGCIITPSDEKITSIKFQQILTDDLPIDDNPNVAGGKRIFPDRKLPTEVVDRRKIRVKSQYYRAESNVRIYFRSFDVDDPSSDTAPIDSNDTATLKSGKDNNGTVDGMSDTKGGLLTIPTSIPANKFDCQQFAKGVVKGLSCLTDAFGSAQVDFTVTMHAGDNFIVVASTSLDYISSLDLSEDGLVLQDENMIPTPVDAGGEMTVCTESSVPACQTDMLTVWRRLHVEVDSMSQISGNNQTGTISGLGGTQCPPPPQNPPCTVYAGFFVNTTSPLEPHRFNNGRIVVNNTSWNVVLNGPNSVIIDASPGSIERIQLGTSFTLYDDDDYNNNDGNLKDGDADETLTRFQDSLSLMAEADARNENVFADAYIMPEYGWAISSGMSQNNIVFDLNIESDETSIDEASQIISANRNSATFESPQFWIVYLMFGYQGPLDKDADGCVFDFNTQQCVSSGEMQGSQSGITKGVVPPNSIGVCDCYLSSTCPMTTIPPITCSTMPYGGAGSIVYLESQSDVVRTWLTSGHIVNEIATTAPHEIGHQFGLGGDAVRSTFHIMDYSSPPSSINARRLHPEHINIMRRRTNSPGQ